MKLPSVQMGIQLELFNLRSVQDALADIPHFEQLLGEEEAEKKLAG